jgi:hypothetical protein
VATTDTRFADLLRAASALAFAHDCRTESCEEWDDLHRAVLAAEESFTGETIPPYEFRDDRLLRRRTLASGEPDERACDIDDLEQVAYAIEERRGDWFVVEEIAGDTRRDWVVAHIAVEFLRRCGLVLDEGIGHRIRAAMGFTAEQAVAEFAVLQIREGERPAGR